MFAVQKKGVIYEKKLGLFSTYQQKGFQKRKLKNEKKKYGGDGGSVLSRSH